MLAFLVLYVIKIASHPDGSAGFYEPNDLSF